MPGCERPQRGRPSPVSCGGTFGGRPRSHPRRPSFLPRGRGPRGRGRAADTAGCRPRASHAIQIEAPAPQGRAAIEGSQDFQGQHRQKAFVAVAAIVGGAEAVTDVKVAHGYVRAGDVLRLLPPRNKQADMEDPRDPGRQKRIRLGLGTPWLYGPVVVRRRDAQGLEPPLRREADARKSAPVRKARPVRLPEPDGAQVGGDVDQLETEASAGWDRLALSRSNSALASTGMSNPLTRRSFSIAGTSAGRVPFRSRSTM